jgi:hypothetical protein
MLDGLCWLFATEQLGPRTQPLPAMKMSLTTHFRNSLVAHTVGR